MICLNVPMGTQKRWDYSGTEIYNKGHSDLFAYSFNVSCYIYIREGNMAIKWHKTQFPGVRFRENPAKKHNGKPDRYFTIRYKLNGVLKEEGLGWSSQEWNAQKASFTRNELIKGQRTGEGPATLAEKRKLAEEKKSFDAVQKDLAEKDNITFNKFVDDSYLPYTKNNKGYRSYIREDGLFKNWINPVIGDIPLKDISPLHLESLKNNMFEDDQSARSVRYALAVIRQVFNYARFIKFYNGSSPIENIKFPQADNKRLRFLTLDEAILLLQEVKKRSLQLYQLSLLSLRTGARADEMFSLKWCDVDFNREMLTLWDTKNTKTRVVRMTADIKQMFQEMRSPDFLLSEFHSRIPVNRLCSKIYDDLNRYFNQYEKSVEWLNSLLINIGLLDILKISHPSAEYSDKLKGLVDQCRLFNKKSYSQLTVAEQDALKRRNRLLIEETYPTFTPKNVAKTELNIQDYVFLDDTGKKIVAISRTFARTVAEIGLNKGITDRRMKVVFHTLRHTYASWLVEKGVDLYTVKELIGHSSLAMTERYSHVGENAKTMAVRKLDKIDLDLNQVQRDTV